MIIIVVLKVYDSSNVTPLLPLTLLTDLWYLRIGQPDQADFLLVIAVSCHAGKYPRL